MTKVKVSEGLTKILKNFSTINKSIVIEPGNVVSTLSVNKNILAKATVSEKFPNQVAIYDLGVFLGGVTLFDEPVFDLENESFVSVSNERSPSKSKYYYADPDIIVKAPAKDIQLPTGDGEFDLKEEDLLSLLKASSIYQVPDLCVTSEDGAKLYEGDPSDWECEDGECVATGNEEEGGGTDPGGGTEV